MLEPNQRSHGVALPEQRDHAVNLLRQARLRIEELESQIHAPIALVGIGCRFPGQANSPAAFWRNLIEGQDAIRRLPADRTFVSQAATSVDSPRANSVPWGGFLTAVDQFDAGFFAISGREAPYMDPQQRLLLETAWEAIEAAGVDPTSLSGSKTGVFVGISNNDYRWLQQTLGTPVNAYAGVGNALSMAANRLSYLLDLRGPSLAIDTACSSSLVAVHQACQSLRRGECDGALVGGVNLIFNPEITSAFMQAGMLAADGRCKSFDARADGYVRSEGAGMVYLMRLADAQCQGHPIIAVIRGSAVNQDGRSNGLTAPNGAAQQRVIRAALQDAGVEPTEIGYVEAHGTGTSLGDPIEVHALKSVLLEDRTADQLCWLGTVKANIGHLEAAAGMAGFIKTALCLHHGQIPRQLHLQNINPHINLSETPLRIPTSVQEWPLPDGPSYAGVSSFGFGGVNAHLILSAAPPVNRPVSPIDRTHHLFTLAAKTAPALTKMAQAYAETLRVSLESASAESNYTESTRTKPVHGNVALDALCYTVNTGRAHFTHRLTVVTHDTTQLHAALSAVGSGRAPASVRLGTRTSIDDPAVTFLFSGQGAQNDAMGRQLYESAPIFRQTIDQCDQILRPLLGCSLVDLLYPPEPELPESRRGQLDQTVYTQPALFAVEYALAQLWLSLGIKPAVVMGHSSGEIVAACVAGAFTLADGLRLIVRRGQLMQSLSADGAMMVVFADEATVRGLLAPFPDQLAIAAINGDTHIVVAGACAAINQLEETLTAAGITHRALRASQAFHSPLMEPILTELAAEAALIDFQPLQIELVSTLTGRLLPVGYRFRAQHWRDHARQPVRFTQAVDLLIAQGQRHFLEIGPTPVLCGLGKRYVVDSPVDWLPSLNPHQADWKTFLDSLASLYLLGLPIEWQALYQPVAPPRLALPTYPFQRKRYWLPEGNYTMHTAGTDPSHAISPAPMLAATKHEASASPLQSILRELRTMVAALLKIPVDEVGLSTPFLELGADSLLLIEATRAIEARYAVKIEIRSLFDELSTLAALAEHIAAHLPVGWAASAPLPAQVESLAVAYNQANTRGASSLSTADLISATQNSDPPRPMTSSSLSPESAQRLLEIVSKQLDLLARYDLGVAFPEQPARTLADAGQGAAQPAQESAIEPAVAVGVGQRGPKIVPLTDAQQQLWFLSQLSEEASIAYNESVSLYLSGALDLSALQHAIQALVDRHEALRIVIDPMGQEQQILPVLDIQLPLVDLSNQNGQQPIAVERWLEAESRRLMDLAKGPLFRVNLLKLAPEQFLLVMTAHHIIIDGLSMSVLLHELGELYSASVAQRAVNLPAAPLFSQYVNWLSAHLQSDAMVTQESYWLEQLKGALPVLELPLDRQRPPLQSYAGAVTTLMLDQEITAALVALSKQAGVTLFMTLFAAYTLLLHRLSGQEEVIVGIPAAGRAMPEGQRIVGYCAHLLPVRHALVDNPNFAELLQTVRNILLDAYAHQDYPFARLINKLNVSRDLSLSPIVGSTFNLTREQVWPPFATLATRLGPRPTSFVDHELGVNIIESGGALTVDFEYNRNLFDAATVQRIAGHFESLLRALLATPNEPVATLPLLTASERTRLLVDWNETSVPFEARAGYHQLFERQVAKTPNAVAVRFEAQVLTYAELNQMANSIAHQLQEAGVGVESLVALLCERSPFFLAAAIAIFKAGGAYLPLDTRAPISRQAQILAQSQSKWLLITSDFDDTSSQVCAALSDDAQLHVLRLDELITAGASQENLTASDSTEDVGARLAYVIYTSGSTGLPKGAMVEQRGMMNHMLAKIRDLRLTADDVIAQTAPQSFDISVWQFFSALILGGVVHIFPDQVAADPLGLLQETAAQEITILEVVPSLLRMMLDELSEGAPVDLHKLRWMIPTGEALPPNLARQWLHFCPQIPLVNAYGPTECSDDVTHYFVTEPPAASVVNMPIGRPLMNMRMYILDAHQQPAPIGVAGELYVGGIGVGRGYIHDPERTAQAFVPDLFSTDPQARLYKTGDKARYLPDGNIEYLGRLDYQVKIRGFRIELGEIEAVLEQHPAVYQAIVMDQADPTGNKRLVAYVAPADDESESRLTTSRLRAFLSEKLPDYMTPSIFITLAQMPLTPNGKVDRKALPAPTAATWGAQNEYVAPQNELQAQLVTIWAGVLKVEPETIGIMHNFFELGGHSLLGVQIIARVRKTFQVDLPIRALMENPTVAGMAAAIENLPVLPSAPQTKLAVELADTTREVINL